jgi:hypothetical protein
MKNIHILQQTDKPSRLHEYDFLSPMGLSKEYLQWRLGRNIYITSDEEIKEGDCVIDDEQDVFQVLEINYTQGVLRSDGFTYVIDVCKKIILTTDVDLIKDGVQAIDDEFLEWFIKNPSCEEVEVETKDLEDIERELNIYGHDIGLTDDELRDWIKSGGDYYKIIIPKEEPKQYKCTECNWLGLLNEMKNEQDTDYDQYCCPKCNNVMYDCRFDKWYLEEPKQETIEEAKKKYVYDKYKQSLDDVVNNAIDFGAKWQQETYSQFTLAMDDLKSAREGYLKGKEEYRLLQERSYSEEELLELFQKYISTQIPLARLRKILHREFKEWFEQFKKK